ncbi:Protein of unknown function [Sphingobium faniae]|nr:Protein of unknown function [Sphingobium faniae]
MQKQDNAQVLARLAALKDMTVRELKSEWQALMGSAAPNNSRSFLEQRLAYRIQELTLGGVAKPVRQLLDALADEVEGKKVRKSVISDPRNPLIGTRLVREWDGAEHVITVLSDGFDWQGRRYKSLSAVARDITGTQWNGYRFFGLRENKRDAA